MANKAIFAPAPPADVTRNNAGGVAYALGAEAALAQYVMTGTFNSTFYADARADTARVVALANEVTPEYLAQLAVHAREAGYMKDAPAVMLAVLSARSPELFRQAFPRVIDNGKMLRTFVQCACCLTATPERLKQCWRSRTSAMLNRRSFVWFAPSGNSGGKHPADRLSD